MKEGGFRGNRGVYQAEGKRVSEGREEGVGRKKGAGFASPWQQ